MPFENVYLVSTKLNPLDLAEVRRLEEQLGYSLPSGYQELITRFGEGNYCDFTFWRPSRLRDETSAFQHMVAEYWFFETQEGVQSLSQEQALESVVIAVSGNGDYLVFYPPRADRVYVLPRHSDVIETLNVDLSDLCAWSEGTSTIPNFTSFVSRAAMETGSFDESLGISNLVQRFRERWPNSLFHMVVERYGESDTIIFFLQEIGARVQITCPPTRASSHEPIVKRIFLRIDYDAEADSELDAFLATILPEERHFTRKYGLPEA